VVGDIGVSESLLTVPVRVLGLPAVDAFGFEVGFTTERLEFLEVVWMGPFEAFEQSGVVEGTAGHLRLGDTRRNRLTRRTLISSLSAFA